MSNQPNEDKDDQGEPEENPKTEDSSAHDQPDEDEHKHGEGHGNLHRRSDWFQKRHGGG